MTSRALDHPRPEPLPATMSEWTRYAKKVRTLNDLVEDIHLLLYDTSEEYRNYLEAVWDEDAVEGSLAADNFKAAEMIRTKAKEINPAYEVGNKKLATIVHCLGIMLRRYHKSRKERRNTVHGEMVPNDTGN